MAFLDDVKVALRITHTKLDSDLQAKIAAARDEMIRIGVDAGKASSEDDPLIVEAIKTYCQYKYTDDEKAQEGYWNSWVTQVDALRKSADYGRSDDNV